MKKREKHPCFDPEISESILLHNLSKGRFVIQDKRGAESCVLKNPDIFTKDITF
jgi:hypothetical protein